VNAEHAERTALTGLCHQLAELRVEMARQPAWRQELLAHIEDEARARRPILELLARLVGTDPAGVVRALPYGLPGLGAGRADEERFGCPDRACDRVALTVPAGPLPRCLLTDQSMVRRAMR
jgi:hypothetical protein